MSPSQSACLGAALMAVLGALLLSLSGGCASDDTGAGAMTGSDYDELAQALGSLVALDSGGETASLGDAVALAGGALPAGFMVAADGSIVGARGTLRYGYTVRCRDAGGALLATCAMGADGATLAATWSGDYQVPRFMGAVSRDGDWRLAAVPGPIATLTGDSELYCHSTVLAEGHAAQLYHLQASATYDVRIAVATGAVVGGTIRYGLDAAPLTGGERTRRFALAAELAIEPGGGATLTLDGDHRYRVDTRTGVVAPR